MSTLVEFLSLLHDLSQYCLTFATASFCAGAVSPIGYLTVFEQLFSMMFDLSLIGSGSGPVLASATFDHYRSCPPGPARCCSQRA